MTDDEQRVAAIREQAESDAHWARGPGVRAEATEILWLLDRLRTAEAERDELRQGVHDMYEAGKVAEHDRPLGKTTFSQAIHRLEQIAGIT